MKGLIGDRQFYKKVLMVAVPIMIQNGITNFVNMLDNIMVGQIGTEPMSGVAIVNQLIFVFNLCIFGAVAGAGILGAQFYGSGNHEGVRNALRFKIISAGVLTAICAVILVLFNEPLINAFLHEGEGQGDLAATLAYGKEYLKFMLIGLVPFALTQAYSGTLRETGQTIVPMVSGIIAVFVNLFFNYVLIFGHFGAPELGVAGAAIATSMSRFVEMGIVMIWTHKHTKEHPFAVGLYRNFHVPMPLVRQILRVGAPLLVNEVLWSVGMTMMTQCYSVRGLEVVAAINISNTLGNVFNVVGIAMGNATGIIIGQILGAGDLKRAKDEDRKMLAFSVMCCMAAGLVMFLIAPVFPQIYNTDPMVKELATWFIRIAGMAAPIFGFVNATYFTLRSGGKTGITFVFDSGYMWVLTIPLVFCLSRFTSLSIVAVFFICQFSDLVKVAVGAYLIKKGSWLQNMVIK